jgi:hypothetical protein
MKSCAHEIKSGFFQFLPIEWNVFSNCITVIHTFRTMDETEYLLLVVVEKGGWGITKSRKVTWL